MRGALVGRRRAATLIGVAAVLAVAGCTSSHGTGPATTKTVTQTVSGGRPTSSSAAPAGQVTVTNSAQGHSISPSDPVRIAADGGTLTSVVMRNPAGRVVTGELAPDGTSWHNTEVLGYAKTYRVTAIAKNSAGQMVKKRTKVRTVRPDNLTQPYIDTVYGSPIQDGETYGVG